MAKPPPAFVSDVVKSLGSVLPVDLLRHARNWALLVEYWNYGGVDVEAIAYHAASRLTRATPDYLGLFVESAGGKRYSVRQTIQGVTTGLNSSNKLHT